MADDFKMLDEPFSPLGEMTGRQREVLDQATPFMILGRHLLEAGWKPGAVVNGMMTAAYSLSNMLDESTSPELKPAFPGAYTRAMIAGLRSAAKETEERADAKWGKRN